MKLQEMIDTAFGAKEKLPTPQVPTENVKERERAFSDRAKKIEGLRQARLAAGETPRASFVFEVVRLRGRWRTLHGNKHSAAYPDQAAAILAAKKLAIAKRNDGYDVKVVLQRTDGDAVIQAIDD
jgi:hypothetical protein